MTKDKKEDEEYSISEEAKEVGSGFVKRSALGVVNAGGIAVRGIVNVFRQHPKVEELEEEVEEDLEALKEQEADD